MVGHGGSSAGSCLANPTSPIPSHCASIVATSTLRGNYIMVFVYFFIYLFNHLFIWVFILFICAVVCLYIILLAYFPDGALIHQRY